MKTLVFTATYNERENIPILLQEIWQALPLAEVLVVDDSSPDGTGAFLAQLQKTEPRLHVICRPGKLGLGSAHSLAMRYAIRHGYDSLVTMDADLSHAPTDIPRLLRALEGGADFVIGSRYMPGGACDYEGYRKRLSILGNQVAKHLLQIRLHEFTTSFRAFKISKLAQVDFSWIGNYGYSFFLEVVFALHQAGLNIQEIPIHFYNRHTGHSKIPKLEIIRGMRKLVQLFFRSKTQRKKVSTIQFSKTICKNCGSPYLYSLKLTGINQPLTQSHKNMLIALQCLQCDAKLNAPLDDSHA